MFYLAKTLVCASFFKGSGGQHENEKQSLKKNIQ